MELLRFLAVGLVAGWIIGKIRRGHGYGLFGNLLIGAVGSLIGWFLSGFLQVDNAHILQQISLAVAGAILFFFVLSLFKRKKRKKNDEDDE